MLRKPLVAFIGPSGVGKTSFSNRLITGYGFMQATVANTRQRRVDDGPHHRFVDDTTFDRMARNGEFLEVDTYTTYRYGTIAASVRVLLDDAAVAGVLLDLTPRGYEQVHRVYPGVIAIALVPDDPAWLKARLRLRGTETDEEQRVREALLIEYLESVRELALPTVEVCFGPETWDGTFVRIVELIRGAA
mgnify:CR=1 FL=1